MLDDSHLVRVTPNGRRAIGVGASQAGWEAAGHTAALVAYASFFCCRSMTCRTSHTSSEVCSETRQNNKARGGDAPPCICGGGPQLELRPMGMFAIADCSYFFCCKFVTHTSAIIFLSLSSRL